MNVVGLIPQNFDRDKTWHLKDYEARGGYAALKKNHRSKVNAGTGHQRSEAFGPAWPRRRWFSDGLEVELHAEKLQ